MQKPTVEYGFRLGWYSVVNEARQAYGLMRAAIVDSLASDVPPKARRQILEALNQFQMKADWEFDVE